MRKVSRNQKGKDVPKPKGILRKLRISKLQIGVSGTLTTPALRQDCMKFLELINKMNI